MTMLTCSLNVYNDLLERGIARELARTVLPQATYTTFYAGSIHNWVKFLLLGG